MRRLRDREPGLIALAALAVVLVPVGLHGWPTSLRGGLAVAALVGSGLSLVGWRTRPREVALGGLGLFVACALLGGPDFWFPDPALAIFSCLGLVLALAWSGRGAVVAGIGGAVLVSALAWVAHTSWVALVMFSAPGFLAGTVFRLRRETAEQLAERAREVEEERELYAELAIRQERARIAAELHDIIGHAISVMVIQAAAGQRLVDADPERARETFATIADSARRGTEDLQRLVELLGTAEPDDRSDLSLVDDVVARAGRSGLDVRLRFEGDRAGVPGPVAHLAFRVVQESLTNALRHAPGARVAIAISLDPDGRSLSVRVENDPPTALGPPVTGTGQGLLGIRERVQALGGQLVVGPRGHGGWAVEARLPAR